jgi:hypothetical protein
MNSSSTPSGSTPPTPAVATAEAPQKASPLTVLRDQRKTVTVAIVLAVAVFWIAGPMGEWRIGSMLSVGVGLGLVNHLVTEFWLLRLISSGAQPSRGTMIRSTFVRLGVLTVVAVGIAVLFWPEGVALLLGLAIFRLIALVMTGLPLLQELKGADH